MERQVIVVFQCKKCIISVKAVVNAKYIDCLLETICSRLIPVASYSHRPGVVFGFYNFAEAFRQGRIVLIVDFVPGAPYEDGRMVSVTANHRTQVFFMPGIKQLIVIIPFLGSLPGVKCFILNQETHPVAQVEQFRCRRIVTGPDGIAPHFSQDFKLTLSSPYVECSSQSTKIVVIANTLYWDFFTIQVMTVPWSKVQCSESEISFISISNSSTLQNCYNSFVKLRIIKIPQNRF